MPTRIEVGTFLEVHSWIMFFIFNFKETLDFEEGNKEGEVFSKEDMMITTGKF